jgi:hypothetical protein
MRTYWLCALALTLLTPVLVPERADAQLQSGNLYGAVVDDKGSALPGVTITLTGAGSPPQVQVTSATGQFRFLWLAPGSYTLKAELEGFSTLTLPNIAINVGRNTPIELTMSPVDELSPDGK